MRIGLIMVPDVQFRSEWGRYAQGCQAILFVVDTHDTDRIVLARHELHILLEEHLTLHDCPILILANKIDLQPHMSEIELVEALNLDYVTGDIAMCDCFKLSETDLLYREPMGSGWHQCIKR